MTENTSGSVGRFTVDRLKGFTDGVLAIVVTILVLGIDIPEDHVFSEQGLVAFLLRIGWDVLMYAASFWLIAAFWVQHHALFQYLRYCNRTLLWLNILFIFPLTLMPLLTKLKAIYRHDELVVPLFGSAFIVCGLILLGIWKYAISHPALIGRPSIEAPVVRSMTRRILIGPLVSLVAIGLSFLNIHLGTIAFCSMPLFYLSHRLIDSGWETPEESSA
ncbi:MAG: TMEM175 family protein [Planctomycetota bacterium]